ncbi:histidine kinase [Streptomyces albidoflavus]|uniref:sensor histidine kinase n=1 Tax=Streptomyces TaxID=1883 RepID=UPI0004C0D51C|nr:MULTISPECIES: histidine kinase [Streptomyces]SCD98309.1 two-component system, NarL family, sensor histidine kinase DesK [Streptomyces sp. IgraMP-1]MEE1721542.1 histidine kinase [Streptomyces sp. JV186]RZE44044.1 histidine kinase [Streptomyces albidoflavus]RZE63603.1 histidine kinase [Streptomyces albidoflavus]RZE77336.1 histidine kinase [Streptomyces albidoflavus]
MTGTGDHEDAATYGATAQAAIRRPGRWWGRKGTAAKVESYTRISFHLFPVAQLVTALLSLTPVPARSALPVAGALLVHVVLGLRLTGQALDWVAGRRARPRRLLFAYMACGFAGAAIAALVLVKLPDDPPATYYTACVGTYVLFLAFSCGLGVLALRTHRQSLVAVAVATFGGWLLGSALLPAPAAAALALSTLLSAGGLTLASRFSIWLLQAVYELDEARHTRARLAVAEERLRFGRDLHDVLGRNLSVIALKSELAVQLARRERPEAVEQMAEVQRIAQESQREVREVVRGYREADLYTELLGARGVLSAAGITCTVTGTPTGLPRPVQAALAWVVREAVTNVLRHGNAAHCRIALTVVPAGPRAEGRPAVAELTVENDGVPSASAGSSGSSGGHGLAGLRERLAAEQGTLEAGPAGKSAFRLVARVPVPAHEVAESGVPGETAERARQELE